VTPPSLSLENVTHPDPEVEVALRHIVRLCRYGLRPASYETFDLACSRLRALAPDYPIHRFIQSLAEARQKAVFFGFGAEQDIFKKEIDSDGREQERQRQDGFGVDPDGVAASGQSGAQESVQDPEPGVRAEPI
jgi:hypothetical protein